MTTYTATFFAANVRATDEIEAETLQQALDLARKLADHDSSGLDWYPCDPCADVEEIDIESPDGDAGVLWQREDLRLRLAAPALAEALSGLLDQVVSLTGESSCIDEDILQGEAYQHAVAVLAMVRPLAE